MNYALMTSFMVVFFSYLIWVQSYRKNISEIESRIHSYYSGDTIVIGSGQSYALNFNNIRCEEDNSILYSLKKNLTWFGNIKGETKLSAHLVYKTVPVAWSKKHYTVLESCELDYNRVLGGEAIEIEMETVQPKAVEEKIGEAIEKLIGCEPPEIYSKKRWKEKRNSTPQDAN